MPHVQREQHQPLKSSPSTQIKRLFIHRLCVRFGFELGYGGAEDINASSEKGNSCLPENIFYWKRSPDQVTKVLLSSW